MCLGKLYTRYLKEREGLDVIHNESGFIVFKLGRKTAFINDYYVRPDDRKKGIGYKLADEVFELAKENDLGVVLCQSDMEAEGHELSRLTILNYGFKEVARKGSVIQYCMEVSKWEK